MSKNWVLLGMMGSGKSSIGKALAERTGRSFVDTDILIEQRLGRRIPEVFRVYGEAAFRDHETSVLRGLQIENAVIATGGGIAVRGENWTELRRLGITAFLDVDHDVLCSRLQASRRKRPLLAEENWDAKLAELSAARRSDYAKADLHFAFGPIGLDAWVERAEEELRAAEKRLESEST